MEIKRFLKNINISIKKNKLIGIYGTNGSGKSTLLDIIFGFAKPKVEVYLLTIQILRAH